MLVGLLDNSLLLMAAIQVADREDILQNLIIVGAGQFGRELYSWVLDCIKAGAQWNVKGFIDDNPASLDGFRYDLPIISDIASYQPVQNDVFICSISNINAKIRCCSDLVAKGANFINVIHPTVVIGQNVTLGYGVILGPYAVFTCDLTIGNFVTISGHSGAGHDTTIGDWCHINGWCTINGCATLGEAVFLGTNAIILPSAKIGKYAYVGAGSLVLRRVKDYEKVFGTPAVRIGMTQKSDI